MKKKSYLALIWILLLSFVFTFYSQPSDAENSNITYKVQKRLKGKGYDPGAIDGIMGAKTITAIKSFQKDNNIAITGKIDSETKRKLGINDVSNTKENSLLLKSPLKLLPEFTLDKDYGTKVILKKASRDDTVLLVIPKKDGYSHTMVFAKTGIESSAWSQNAIHEVSSGVSMGGYTFNPSENTVLTFIVDCKRGYVFKNGQGRIQLPNGDEVQLDEDKIGYAIGTPTTEN